MAMKHHLFIILAAAIILAQAAEQPEDWRLFRYKDTARYMSLLKTAAEAGVPRAQLDLAEEHLEGLLAAVDEEKAVELARKAADAGLADAKFGLAEMYACGIGEPRQSSETPMNLNFEAAKGGSGEAMRELGRRYRFGLGTERDLMEAARWYWRAAARGSRPIQTFLDPEGEPLANLDPETAAFARFFGLYAKAQRTADPAAMLKVGEAFLAGEQGKANVKTGYYWLLRAGRHSQTAAAPLIQKAKSTLSRKDMAEVEREVQQDEAMRQWMNVTDPRLRDR